MVVGVGEGVTVAMLWRLAAVAFSSVSRTWAAERLASTRLRASRKTVASKAMHRSFLIGDYVVRVNVKDWRKKCATRAF
jgi:hypothetical protein